MALNLRGGIARSGSSGSFSYVVRPNMGDKPVNFVSWFDAARFANWLQNGQGSGDTETGAYTLVGGQTTGPAPAQNTGAHCFVPTEDQWYKPAYDVGGGTNARFWDFATGSDSAPVAVTAGTTGTGSAGPGGNFANSASAADFRSADRDPGDEDSDIGFRLATVPGPSTCVITLAGPACGGYSMGRRRKRA